MPESPAPPPAPDLAAIAARYTRATSGPWFDDDGYRVLAIGMAIIAEMKYLPGYPVAPSPHDVAFIAAARTDVPALVAYARALEAENARLRAALVPLAYCEIEIEQGAGGGPISIYTGGILPGDVRQARVLLGTHS